MSDDGSSSPTVSTDGTMERIDSMPTSISNSTIEPATPGTDKKGAKKEKKEKKEKKKEIEILKKEEALQKKEEKKLKKLEKKQQEELAREEKKLREAEKKIEKKIQKEEQKQAKEMQKKVAKETVKTRELPTDGSARLLRVFEGNNEYRIKYFQGTPSAELYQAVKKEANITTATDISLLDEDGDPVALSSHMPSGTCLYIQRAGGTVVSRTAAARTQRWTWDVVTRTCGKHVLSEDGLTLSQNHRAGYGGVRATEGFSSGVHWWVVKFEPLQECVCGGVLGSEELVSADNVFLSPFGFHDAVLNGRNEGPIECGFLLNMDTAELRVYNLSHGVRKCSVKYVDVPRPAYPAIAIKHITKATLLSTTMDSMPDNLITEDDNDRLASKLSGFESESFVL